MESLDDFLTHLQGTTIKYISLTTTLKGNDADLLKKSNALHPFV